jgi:cytochrome b involved in lipid metabolism
MINDSFVLNLKNKGRKIIISKNKVYDVTDYYNNHPGGNCILKSTDCYRDYKFHSKKTRKTIWKKYYIGKLI